MAVKAQNDAIGLPMLSTLCVVSLINKAFIFFCKGDTAI